MPISQSISFSQTPNLLYRSDCKDALQHLIDQGVEVDLIYLDPPFNSNRVYGAAHQKAFSDVWRPDPQTQERLQRFGDSINESSEVSNLVKMLLRGWVALLKTGDLSIEDQRMLVYLAYMTERLLLMKKVLKATGSLYFHCDPTSSHYVKVVLDGIFGRKHFVNEIVWHYYSGGSNKKRFAKKHDIILFYAKSKGYYFRSSKERKYVKGKKVGREQLKNAVREWLEDGRGTYTLINRRDTWYIPMLNPMSRERWGYSTQKPRQLTARIVEASCPKGGVVLDPFCGSGTTLESAVLGGKHWIGVDVGLAAVDLTKTRLKGMGQVEGSDYVFIDAAPTLQH